MTRYKTLRRKETLAAIEAEKELAAERIYIGSTLAPKELRQNRKQKNLPESEVSDAEEVTGLEAALAALLPRAKNGRKGKKPVDRVGRRREKETTTIKKKVKKANKKEFDPKVIKKLAIKPNTLLRGVQYMSELDADTNSGAGMLEPASEIVKGVLTTWEERRIIREEQIRKAQEAEQAKLARMSQRQRDLYHLARGSLSKERSTSKLDLYTGDVLSARGLSKSGNKTRAIPRRSGRSSSRVVEGAPARVGAPQPSTSSTQTTMGVTRQQSYPASSDSIEEDDEEDDEPGWSVNKFQCSPSRGTNYFQPHNPRNLAGLSPTIIEELGNGFSEDDEDEEEDSDEEEDELDEDVEHESDDDCDSVMPSPPRKWIEAGSPFSRPDDDDGAYSSSDSDEDEKIAKELIPVPPHYGEKQAYSTSGSSVNGEDDDCGDPELVTSLSSVEPYTPYIPSRSTSPCEDEETDGDKENDMQAFNSAMDIFMADHSKDYHPMCAFSDDSGCYEAVTRWGRTPGATCDQLTSLQRSFPCSRHTCSRSL